MPCGALWGLGWPRVATGDVRGNAGPLRAHQGSNQPQHANSACIMGQSMRRSSRPKHRESTMVKKVNWETITSIAAEPSAEWSNTDIARFHYFNPNGLYSKKKAINARITEAVDMGKCRSGAIIAHGSLNDYTTNKIIKLATQRRCSRIKLRVAIDMLEDDILRAEKFLATID